MDFKGQQLSEQIFYYIVIAFGIVGWIHGYIKQSIYFTVIWWFIGVLISIVLSVPDWPYFNRNPVKWLSPIGERGVQEERNQVMKDRKKR